MLKWLRQSLEYWAYQHLAYRSSRSNRRAATEAGLIEHRESGSYTYIQLEVFLYRSASASSALAFHLGDPAEQRLIRSSLCLESHCTTVNFVPSDQSEWVNVIWKGLPMFLVRSFYQLSAYFNVIIIEYE